MSHDDIGIEQARAVLGQLADKAHADGHITHLTRNGRQIASIVPAGMKSTALPDAAVDAAMDAAWPGLPEGVSLGEARRRTIAALNAAYPHLVAQATAEAAEAILGAACERITE